MHEFEKKLEALGYSISEPVPPAAIYKPVVVTGNIAYCSGAIPTAGGQLRYQGSVQSVVTLTDAQQSAALSAVNNLRQLNSVLGSLGRISRVIRLTGFVNSDPDFTNHHLVINGASELLRAVFGESGVGARSALGVANLPLGATTETELIVELHPD